MLVDELNAAAIDCSPRSNRVPFVPFKNSIAYAIVHNNQDIWLDLLASDVIVLEFEPKHLHHQLQLSRYCPTQHSARHGLLKDQ
jgi:hypothetical protein